MTNQAVENYLKCIYSLTQKGESPVSTNAIADRLHTKASSVTDMLKKLKAKGLVNYEKYQGGSLTAQGEEIAIKVIRKHRLWEVFLVDKLKFGWEEVHDIAEQLEHIHSPELVSRLDEFLGRPRLDPHGDPIPDEHGNILVDPEVVSLDQLATGERGVVVGVKDSHAEFLSYLQQMKLTLGAELSVINIFEYDDSMKIELDGSTFQVSNKVSENLQVKRLS